MRFGIYARYSSDNQNERSIEDQVRLCQEYVASQGGVAAEVYADFARSGAHALSRPALQSMLRDAKAGKLDVLVAEALDRISRDQEDIAAIFKRLTHAGVAIHTLSEGDVNELHVGLKGTMNALFLKDLAAKIRRGQRGRAEAKRSPGGLSYGYDVVKEYDADGEPVRGKRSINPEQAAVVRRIFRDYAGGKSCRQISAELNRDGIPAPAGGKWRTSTIVGNRARRSGFLYNEAYIGLLVYNRLRMVRDPDTGKRIPRPNPREQWVVIDAPALRIVDDKTWAICHRRKEAYAGFPLHVHRRPKHLLSGLLRCGICGGGMSAVKPGRIGCTAHRDGRHCANNQTIAIGEIERRVLDGIRDGLLCPEVVSEYIREWHKGMKARRQSSEGQRKTAKKEMAESEGKIARLIAAIEEGTDSPALRLRLKELEARRAVMARALEEPDEPEVIEMHPRMAEKYRAKIDRLAEDLRIPESREEAVSLLRAQIENVELTPTGERGRMTAVLSGNLASALTLAREDGAPGMILLVAEEGFRRNHPIVKVAI